MVGLSYKKQRVKTLQTNKPSNGEVTSTIFIKMLLLLL